MAEGNTIACISCGNEVSRSAKACPKCKTKTGEIKTKEVIENYGLSAPLKKAVLEVEAFMEANKRLGIFGFETTGRMPFFIATLYIVTWGSLLALVLLLRKKQYHPWIQSPFGVNPILPVQLQGIGKNLPTPLRAEEKPLYLIRSIGWSTYFVLVTDKELRYYLKAEKSTLLTDSKETKSGTIPLETIRQMGASGKRHTLGRGDGDIDVLVNDEVIGVLPNIRQIKSFDSFFKQLGNSLAVANTKEG